MTNDPAQPRETERYSIASLVADAADVRRVLHLDERRIQLPAQTRSPVLTGDIPDRALALVAGLDSYGD